MRKLIIASALGLLVTTAAFGLPWDIDMADTQAIKGYASTGDPALDKRLRTLPEGVVAQRNILTPLVSLTQNAKRGTPAGEALKNPLKASPEVLALGKKMYETNCSFCHGSDGINLGPVAQPGRFPAVVALAGKSGIAKLRSDPWIYLTIRNGSAVMPNYGWAMSDAEMWSIVHHVRTLKNTKFTPPRPAPKPEQEEGNP